MARKAHKALVIAPTPEETLAAARHTDWQIAQERGYNRCGRRYLVPAVHGVDKTKKGRSRKACRGKVAY